MNRAWARAASGRSTPPRRRPTAWSTGRGHGRLDRQQRPRRSRPTRCSPPARRVGEKVIGVASFDNAQRAFSVAGTPFGFNSATGSPLPPRTRHLPLAQTGTPATADDACDALPPGSLTGQAVLIRRGTCGFTRRPSTPRTPARPRVVLYNNAAGAVAPTVAGAPPITIPVVAITAAQGVR